MAPTRPLKLQMLLKKLQKYSKEHWLLIISPEIKDRIMGKTKVTLGKHLHL